ncbi:MAG: hypothetical protein ACTS3F_07220 [Phycisphaerales bacterium]
MKKVLLWIGLTVLALVAGVAILIALRPKAPERDYIAEYDAMIAQRFPDGSDGIDDFEALIALDRMARIEQIAESSALEAQQWGVQQGLEMGWFELPVVVEALLHDEPAFVDEPLTDEERSAMEQVLARARERAIPRILAVLEDPEALRLARAFNEHEVVVVPAIDAPSLFDRLLPHLSQTRAIARADAVLFARSDDPSVRQEMLASMLGQARLGGTSPILIGGLVRAALESLAVDRVLDAATNNAIGSEEARAMIAEFLKHRDLRPETAWYFEGERLGSLDIIDAEYTKRPGAMRLNTITTAPVIGVSHGRMYEIIDEFYGLMIQQAGQPPALRDPTAIDPDAFIRNVDLRARPLLGALLPAFSRALQNFDLIEADLAGATTALAIAAYMDDHDGAPPPSLQSLVPDYLPDLPADPFAERPATPLVYKTTDDGQVLLYSLGPNLTDEGAQSQDPDEHRKDREDLVYWPWER